MVGRSCGGEAKLVPVAGIFNSADEIPFSALPDSFIIRCTHGKKWCVKVEDKNNHELFQEDAVKRKLNR